MQTEASRPASDAVRPLIELCPSPVEASAAVKHNQRFNEFGFLVTDDHALRAWNMSHASGETMQDQS